MANSLLSSLLRESSFRIYDDRTGVQIWRSMGIISVEVESQTQNAERPLSNIQFSGGGTFEKLQESDVGSSKIIRPSRLRITGIIPDIATTESVINAWQDLFATFTVISRSVVADDLTVTQVEFDQTPEMLNVQLVTIEMDQVQIPSIDGFNPGQPADNSTYGIKIQTPASVISSVSDLYNHVTSSIGRFI